MIHNMYFSEEQIKTRREQISSLWNTVLKSNDAILIHSGEPIQKPGGLDSTYPFLPHPSYFWLTLRRRETEVLLYSRDLGWIEFHKEISNEDIFWEGEKNDILVSSPGKNINSLKNFLESQHFSRIFYLGQAKDASPEAFELRTLLDKTRRKKDALEVSFIRHIAEVANYGYQKIASVLKPGITEREVQIAYESEIFRKGADTVPYETIVGSGSNSALLHALPSQKIIKENEFVLVDAGADIFDYCVDITRTFYSSGEMSSQHKDLYSIVLKAYHECVAMSKAGVFWRDVHIHSAKVITEGLLQLGILKGNLSDLIEKEIVSLFYPHGVGHLVGLRVRDTGQEENLNPKTYFGARLRVDLELEENHLITVEPGCYFMPAILESAHQQKEFYDDINWDELKKWHNIGGVRIEDNILIKKDGNENLTNRIAKTE
ncbi:M24 family metallopeptidase [Chryseobacterium sp. MIQD13]|uniref:M24 family metallopeptidase n=1 Tax=Chryseobacterium sp. MIQD13 TaxID=3422310 RepID=UPI003D292846